MSLLAVFSVSAFAGSAITTFAHSFKAGVAFLLTSAVIVSIITLVTFTSTH